MKNAYQKLEQAQKRAEEKKSSSQRTIERLREEYDQMVIERRESQNEGVLGGDSDEPLGERDGFWMVVSAMML